MSATRMLAVDFGASGGKCFSGTLESGRFTMEEVHRFAHEGVSLFLADRKGTLEERTVWDDTYLYQQILKGLQAYRRVCGQKLDSIGIDTWGADGHLMSADGDLLGKVYCYRDHRLDRMVEQVKQRIDARRVYEITGIHFQPFNVSNQLLWLAQNRPGLFGDGVFYLPIPSLFYHYLGGVHSVDSTWASVTQLMDARTRQWSGEILKALGIPATVMPEIVAPGTVVGRLHEPLARLVGVDPARLVAVAAHDTASAFAAAPVSDPARSLIISSGTWSLVGKLVAQPITSTAAMAANISNEGGIGNTRFLKNCMGMWLVQELRRGWAVADGKEMSWKEMDRITLEAPLSTAWIDPDHASFYNPANMEQAMIECCRKTGQQAPKDRGGMIRMVYESLALKYRFVNEQIDAVSGSTTTAVHIVGGGSKNIMLNQCAADVLGLPVYAGPEEATAVGNFMIQAMGLGLIGSMQEAQPVIRQAFPIREFKPVDTARWNPVYDRFKQVCLKPG